MPIGCPLAVVVDFKESFMSRLKVAMFCVNL